MKLAIGGLVRDRLPQLAIYLAHLRLIEWPDVRWLFVLDNCRPEAEALVESVFPEGVFVRVNDQAPAYNRDGRREYAHMADLRNRFAQEALSLGVDGLLSVDSDIVAVPDLAARLVETDRPWVAAIVDNSRGGRAAYNIMWRRDQAFYRQPINREHGGSADLIGAACFYRRDVLERVAFDGGTMSEDTGFALRAAEAGFSGWYIPLELEHLMIDAQTSAHLQRCVICR